MEIIMKKIISLILISVLFISGVALAQSEIGDGGPANLAILDSPSGIAVDRNNNVYIAERRGSRIRKVDAKTGIIKTFVGTGKLGFSGDGGKASKAQIAHPELIAVDSKNNLIITDRGNSRIRKINLKTGIIETVAGTGVAGYDGDGGLATKAKISYPFGLGLDKDDNLFIADTENHAIRRVDTKTGIISTVAGNGKAGFTGDGGLATKASLNRPHNFVFDEKGNLIIGDSVNQRIRIVDAKTNRIKTLYGVGEMGFSEDGTKASTAKFGYFGTFLINKKSIIFSEWVNKRIRLIDRKTGRLASLTDSKGKTIEIGGPYGMATDNKGFLYVVGVHKNQVIKINPKNGKVKHFAGKKKILSDK